jgi:hypothetical protein
LELADKFKCEQGNQKIPQIRVIPSTSRKEGKIRIFICDCRGEIEVPEELDFGKDVIVVRDSYLCSEEGISKVRGTFDIGERIIIAGCTPLHLTRGLDEVF